MDGEEVIIIGGATIGGWAAVTDNAILDRLKPDAKTNVSNKSLFYSTVQVIIGLQ
jgi:hypothetical protein